MSWIAMRWASVAAIVLAGMPGSAGGDKVEVKEGQAAPDVVLPATQIRKVLPEAGGKTLALKDLQGKKNVVLFFYPRAMTPGCTKEACGFRDRLDKFAELDTAVLGISTDQLADQEKFSDREKLTFPLLADADKKAARAFGVLSGDYADRKTFVIDKKGTIRKIYTKVKVDEHPDEVLKFVKELAEKK